MTQILSKDRILIIKLGALGDFIQSLGVMRAIRAHHKNAHITLMTTKPFETLARQSGYVDEIIIDRRPKWYELPEFLRLRKALSTPDVSRVYDLQNNDRTALYFKLIPARRRPAWVGAVKSASHSFNPPERTAGHAFDGLKMMMESTGLSDIKIDDLSWVKGQKEFNLPQNFGLVIPGCAPSRPKKRWPAQNFAQIASYLEKQAITPVIIGGENEKPFAKTILSACSKAFDLCGQTDITDLPDLARSARIAIGNDTGPLHIIAQTDCPTIVLFSGDSNPVKHRPLGKNVEVVRSEIIENIDLGLVQKKIGNMIARSSSNAFAE